MRVRYTAAAEIDLQTIYLSGWEMFGRRQADVYAAGLRAAVQMIADFPLRRDCEKRSVSPCERVLFNRT